MSLFEHEAERLPADSHVSGIFPAPDPSAVARPREEVRDEARRNRWLSAVAVVTMVLAVLGTILIGWQVRKSIRELTRQSLKSTLATTVIAIESWLGERRDDAEQLCAHPDVNRRCVDMLERDEHVGAAVEDSPAESEMVARLGKAIEQQWLSPQYLGWVLVDFSGQVVASAEDALVGQQLPFPSDAIHRIETGESTVCRPLASPVAIAGSSQPIQKGDAIMLAIAPVRRGVRPVGALGVILDPTDQFSHILASAHTGDTDETYAFDRAGMMISTCRFESQLRAAGVLPSDPQVTSPLHVRLVDPGVDLTRQQALPTDWQPRGMTLMADQATRGATGEDILGYNGYRGVPVVGAWRWLHSYNFGVATEMDVAEAYGPMRLLRNSFLGLFALLGGCVASMLALANVLLRGTSSRSGLDDHRRLGQYELGELIGSGGMGSVYHGKHQMLRRDVAVKVLEGENVNSKTLSRFEREVQLTSQLQHPNTIEIYDYGRSHDGAFYYVMEYVDGLSLQELVQQFGRQPPGRVIDLLVQICRSLAEAHAASIVHRDVKPANVLITARAGIYDLVKVVDFGLVKQINRETVQLTQSDAITGSPQFMSPEAIRDASSVDMRSDLYSVGAIGYFLLTGGGMFESDSAADVCVKQLNDEPERPERIVGEPLPDDLQNVLMSCLRKNPDDRPSSVVELADALSQCIDTDRWAESDKSQWWDDFFGSR
tara:strand:- start:150286 stop:152427 length:2142 start_codon:yes stop_codon:yes gene_type:complete